MKNQCSIWTSIGTDSTSMSKGIENLLMPLSELRKSWNRRSNSRCNFTISSAYSASVCHFHRLQVHFANTEKDQTHIGVTAFAKILALLQTLLFHQKDCEWVFPFLGRVAEREVKCSSQTPNFRHRLFNITWMKFGCQQFCSKYQSMEMVVYSKNYLFQ